MVKKADFTRFLASALIATAQGARPTFKGDPAACAWYNDTSIASPLDDYSGLFDPRAHPDWRGTRIYDQINVFARANDDSLLWYHLTPINSESFGTVSTVLPGTFRLSTSPAVVQRGPNLIDVFFMDGPYLWHLMWNGISWSRSDVLVAAHMTSLAASSWGPDRIDLFFTDEVGLVFHRSWSAGVGWRGYEFLGTPTGVANVETTTDFAPGGATSAPAAGSWGPNRIDVVVRGEGNAYYRKSYDIGGWGEWESIGGVGVFTSSPSITPTPPFPGGGGYSKINIFGRGPAMNLAAKGIRADGTATSLAYFGGGLNSAPAAINYIGDHFTVFARGIDNTLWWLDWDVGIRSYCDLGEEHFRWEPVPDLPVETRRAAGPIVTEEQDSIIQLVNDTNIPGSDYRDFDLKTADPKLCGLACIDDPTCVACTYVKPGNQGPNARCWLKNNVAAQVPDECCLSGVKEIRAAIPQVAPAQPA